MNKCRKHLWPRLILPLVLPALAAGMVQGQTLVDITNAPTPGPNDISQLSADGNTTDPDGLNYYTDNQIAFGTGEPGQTFTTGTNQSGYVLTSLALKTAGLDSYSGIGTPQPYYLHFYFVSTALAMPVQTNLSSNITFNDGAWLQWSGLSVPLAANTTYAWSFGKASSTAGWEAMAVADGNLYAAGQIGLFPPAGGTITFGSSGDYDAVFDVGLSTNWSQLLAGAPVVSPAITNYLGSPVTLSVAAAGTPPLYYQWQMGGGNGALTNLPNATNATVTVAPPASGVFRFDFIVTNVSGSATGSVAVVTVLPPVNITVNVSQPMAAMPPLGLGVCTAVYDNDLIEASVVPMLKAAGITALRTPGGSYGDVYDWEDNGGIDGAYVNSNDTFDNWMNTDVIPAGAQAIVTVNYGSNPANNAGGDTNVAAAWVAHANVTNNWDVKYWEIGNEIYGNGYYSGWDWEYDLHYPETNADTRVGQPALSPGAYGTNAVQFISAMKAKDPSIKCGVFVLTGTYDNVNNANNTPVLQAVGTNADFVIVHWYPGTDTPSTLAASTGIVATVTSALTELTNVVGAAHASQMQIAITETGAGNATGAPVSLFAADNYLTWLENGIVNVDYQILHTDILLNNQTPGHAYYGAMMAHLLANVGDTFLTATSSLAEFRVHATARQDGRTGVMLVNLDPVLTIPATVNITGPVLAGSGTRYQFGLTNFIGANDFPSYPVSTNTVSGLGNSFTVSVPPYTIVDLLIPPASIRTPPVLAPIGNQTVNVGQTVAFTASATDTNQPMPILTFSLLSGPTNATLAQTDNNDANFRWQPGVANANTTNWISLKVADNGTPVLSATQTFSVTVNPLTLPTLSSVTFGNGQLTFQVNGQMGPDYAVETSTNLLDWNTLFTTNSPLMPFIWTDTSAAAMPVQFYRVKAGPPLP